MPQNSRVRVSLSIALVLLVYALMVWIRAGAGAYEYGQYAENHFQVLSDRTGNFALPLALNEIIYIRERPLTPSIFHVGTLIERALGREGSYVGHVILYNGLIWLTACAVAVMVWLTQRHAMAAFAAGALYLAHGGDGFTNWMGIPHVNGAVLLSVMSIVALLWMRHAERPGPILAAAGLSMGTASLGLLSYEGCLGVLGASPVAVALLLSPGCTRLRKGLVLGTAWAVVGTYTAVYLLAMKLGYAASYQKSLISPEVSLGGLAHDFVQQVWRSVSIWNWTTTPMLTVDGMRAAAVALLFPVSAVCLSYLGRADRRPAAAPSWQRVVAAWALVAAAGFAPFVLIGDNLRFLRTQLFSAPFVAALLAAPFAWSLPTALAGRVWTAALLVLASIWIGLGLTAAQSFGYVHSDMWGLHKGVYQSLLKQVPRVEDQTLVLLVPETEAARRYWSDHFIHDMWIDFPLRSMYAPAAVSGGLYRGTAEDRWSFREGVFTANQDGIRPINWTYPADRVLLLHLSEQGQLRPFNAEEAATLFPGLSYRPGAHVVDGAIPEQVRRRFIGEDRP